MGFGGGGDVAGGEFAAEGGEEGGDVCCHAGQAGRMGSGMRGS
jgi:hypothetical protein